MMKRLLLIVLVLSLVSCEKKEIMNFTSEDCAVYFQRTGGYTYPSDGSVIYSTTYRYVDSMTYSFASDKPTTKAVVVRLPILTMGKVKEYNRPVKVVIDEERTTAVRGVDFEVNLDTVYVPANAGKATLRVTLFRSEDLLTMTKRVAFRLEENEYFKLHIQKYKMFSSWQAKADTLDATRFAVSFNEQYSMPTFYGWYGEEFFGSWSPKKYQLLNEVMGWTNDDWENSGNTGSKISYGRMGFSARNFRKYLQNLADAGTPVVDIDGTYMQLGAEYLVDYSKYDTKE